MPYKLRTLAFAFLAALPLLAIGPSAATAQFESEAAETILTRTANNTQIYQYTATSPPVECAIVGGSGVLHGTASTEITFAPEYEGCSTSFGTTIVAMNGCEYIFTSAKFLTSITTHIVCPPGQSITIQPQFKQGMNEFPLCTYTIGAQTPGGTVSGTNMGAGAAREVKVTSANTGIVASRAGSALCGPLTSTTGTFSGNVTLLGEQASQTQVGFFMD